MAKENMGGLSATMEQQAKLPLYGASEEQLQSLKDAQQKAVEALEQRYAQPNWFKVAAGFAKPQLGGFLASIGSASDALGENIEQQRAQQLPISQMRAQLAQTNLLMGSQQKANEIMGRWKASGKPMDQATYAEITALAPTSSAAAAAKAAYEGGAKDIENTRSQQRAIIDTIQIKQSKGMPLSKTENDFLQNFATGLIGSSEGARAANIGVPNASDGTQPNANQPSGAQPSNTNAAPQSAKPAAYYPLTFEFPDVSNMSDPERKSRELSYQRNTEAAEKKSEDQVQLWRSTSTDPVYSSIDSEYKSAIDLLKTQPVIAKGVFNLLRQDGSLMNQIMSAAQSGFGVNLGSMAANLNLPVEAFARAGLNEEQQLMADRLVRAMLVVGNAKLASQGITPEKGQEAYKQYLDNTKASLQQNPATALHNLQKDYVSFRQSKQLYDQTLKEYRNQQKHSPTPYTDVINNSPEIANINARMRKEMQDHEIDYQEAIRQRAQKRSNQGR